MTLPSLSRAHFTGFASFRRTLAQVVAGEASASMIARNLHGTLHHVASTKVLARVLRSGMPVLLLACGGAGVSDGANPGETPTGPPTTGTVQRTSLSVRVQIDPADAALANAAGVGVAGLTVRLTRAGDQTAPRTAVTDASGAVQFDALLDGMYTASVERTLTPGELDRLPPNDRDAGIFAGGSTVPVSPPATPSTVVSLVAARRGSVVISEVFDFTGTGPVYNWAHYVELYNNSDTTVYLDGMLLAFTSTNLHTAGFAPCNDASFAPYRADPNNIWAESGIRFPGGGRDHPVLPGQALVYAQDALDHSRAAGAGSYPNLAGAQFEHVGTPADTDNPISANVLPIFATGTGAGGRGLRVTVPTSIALVKAPGYSPLDTVALLPVTPTPIGGLPRSPRTFWRVPRRDIIDLVSLDYSAAHKAYLATTTFRYVVCQPWLPSIFEQAEAEIADYRFPGGMRRRSLGVSATGREILMRTRTSARDWERTSDLLRRSLNRER